MNPLVLVDSSFFITHQRNQLDPFALLKDYELDYEFAINGVIWAEVLRGRKDPRLKDHYMAAFSITRMLHLNLAGWQRVANLAWELNHQGDSIPLTTIITGVTALEYGATVLTFDRHYQKIPGLTALSDLE